MIILNDEPEAIDVFLRTIASQDGLNGKLTLPSERKNQRQREYVTSNKTEVYARQVPYTEAYAKTAKAKATRAAWRDKNRAKFAEQHLARKLLCK